MNNRILITGGTGFVGSHLVEYLSSNSDLEIHVTNFGKLPNYFLPLLAENRIHTVNLTDIDSTTHLLRKLKPKYVAHLAAFSAVGNSWNLARQIMENNIGLQETLFQALSSSSSESRVLVVSSAEVYGNSIDGELPINENHPFRPINPYAVSKIAQEMLAYSYSIAHHLDIVRARPFNHTGERQTPAFAIPSFASQIVAIENGLQQNIRVGFLENKRDISDVKDVVSAYWTLLQKGTSGGVYNVGTGKSWKMSEILDILCSLSDDKIEIKSDESLIRPSDIPEIRADVSKLTDLDWEPSTDITSLLSRVLNWWRQQQTY